MSFRCQLLLPGAASFSLLIAAASYAIDAASYYAIMFISLRFHYDIDTPRHEADDLLIIFCMMLRFHFLFFRLSFTFFRIGFLSDCR